MRNKVFLFTLFGIFVSCAGFAAFYVLQIVPHQVEISLGEASHDLDVWEKWRLILLLSQKKAVLTKPANPNGEMQQFQIGFGESPLLVAKRLKEGGLLSDDSSFVMYLRYKGLDKTIQAGDYHLSAAMTPIQIAQTFQDATPKEVPFRVLEGWRIEEIAASLPTSGLNIDQDTFLSFARIRPDGYSFSSELPAFSTSSTPYPVEGFLYPDAYSITRDADAADLITILLKRFDEAIDAGIREGIKRQGLSFYEGVILASIVEREAVMDDEKPLIASVFLNRLRIGMKLEADPTVQYAMGYRADRNGWWPFPLFREDLSIISPYNTYVINGLPPSPICNPGLSSLKAVAFAPETKYIYFRALCDDSKRHAFSETFDQHVKNACP